LFCLFTILLATQPNCIQAVLQWQHGYYQALANNSILYFPIASDGRQRLLNTCSPNSDVTLQFNQTFWMRGWEIVQDPILGTELQLYNFDGSPVQPLYPYAIPPIMLPTETLTPSTNVTQLYSFAPRLSTVSPILVGVAGLLLGTVSVLRPW
jgi:Chaperone for protein-folding within the ER, fungal